MKVNSFSSGESSHKFQNIFDVWRNIRIYEVDTFVLDAPDKPLKSRT